MAKTKVRTETPKRFRGAKDTASITSIVSTIERTYKLPKGSVEIVYKSGRRAGTNIKNLRANWNK